MVCENIVIIPTTHFQSNKRNKIRNTLKDICVFFFAGVSSPNIDRHNYNVCTSSLKLTNITVQTPQDYVLLPIVDSYFNLGNKL